MYLKHQSIFPLTWVDAVVFDSDGISMLVSDAQPVVWCIVKNISRDPTGAFSVTLCDGRVISNRSGTCGFGQRTSPQFSVGIPVFTESHYSRTNVDDLITWTADIAEVISLISRTTLVKFLCTCGCRKYVTLLSRHLDSTSKKIYYFVCAQWTKQVQRIK